MVPLGYLMLPIVIVNSVPSFDSGKLKGLDAGLDPEALWDYMPSREPINPRKIMVSVCLWLRMTNTSVSATSKCPRHFSILRATFFHRQIIQATKHSTTMPPPTLFVHLLLTARASGSNLRIKSPPHHHMP